MSNALDSTTVLAALIIGFYLGRRTALSDNKVRSIWVERIQSWGLFILAVAMLITGYFMYSDVKAKVDCTTQINLLAGREGQAMVDLSDTLSTSTDPQVRQRAFTDWIKNLKTINEERSRLLRTSCH